MNKKRKVYLYQAGGNLLEMPLYNKGNAFSIEERKKFNIDGLLPYRVETIDEQLTRAYERLSKFSSDLDKHIFLRDLQDTNETLFYHLVRKHLVEVLPIIYTPTVGLACELFSQIYRQRRGLFLSYPARHNLKDQIWNIPNKNVKVIVLTDGERILGLGDLGIGGMGIPIGKLSLYTACGGIDPEYTLPIYIDVGTNNAKFLSDQMYLGWQNQRIGDKDYNEFINQILEYLNERWPGVLMQFEDFAQQNASKILHTYQKKYCCFNDDIQGTAAVTLATLISACKKTGQPLKDQKILIVGAGSAATGIANLIVYSMVKDGMDIQDAYKNIYLCNSKGLLCENTPYISDFQKPYVKKITEIKKISPNPIPTFQECIVGLKNSVLIGVSGQSEIFTEEIVKQMLKNNENPIIFPLSNPTSKAEAMPEDLIHWSDGRAVIATGSPFDPVTYKNKTYTFSQCNNCFVFPGIGLGAVSARPLYISDDIILEAALVLANYQIKNDGELLPDISQVPNISREIAFAVFKQAIKEKTTVEISDDLIKTKIEENFWDPVYKEYRRTAF